MKRFYTLFTILLLFFPCNLISQDDTGNFSVKAGVGTDIGGGLGFGAGVGYLFPSSNVELNVVLFMHSSEETSEEYHTYTETTDLIVFGVMANYLIAYPHKKTGAYGIVGFGFSAINLDWEETSPTDGSLGTPLPGGGSKQNESGTGAGSVLNGGFGYSFGNLQLRAEFPVIISFAPPGEAAGVAPTFMLTLGYQF